MFLVGCVCFWIYLIYMSEIGKKPTKNLPVKNLLKPTKSCRDHAVRIMQNHAILRVCVFQRRTRFGILWQIWPTLSFGLPLLPKTLKIYQLVYRIKVYQNILFGDEDL